MKIIAPAFGVLIAASLPAMAQLSAQEQEAARRQSQESKRRSDEAMRKALEAAEKHEREAAEFARRAEEAREEAARRAREAEQKSPFIKEPYRPDAGQRSAAVPPRVLLDEAAALEAAGRGSEAVKAYERAARSGSGEAALRLAEIYDKGIPGVAADYPASLRWRNAARVLGEDVPLRR